MDDYSFDELKTLDDSPRDSVSKNSYKIAREMDDLGNKYRCELVAGIHSTGELFLVFLNPITGGFEPFKSSVPDWGRARRLLLAIENAGCLSKYSESDRRGMSSQEIWVLEELKEFALYNRVDEFWDFLSANIFTIYMTTHFKWQCVLFIALSVQENSEDPIPSEMDDLPAGSYVLNWGDKSTLVTMDELRTTIEELKKHMYKNWLQRGLSEEEAKSRILSESIVKPWGDARLKKKLRAMYEERRVN